MVLTRWDPLFEIRRARRLAGFSPSVADRGSVETAKNHDWTIPVDIVKDGDSVTVQASLPGVKPEEIDVTIEGGVLTIKADTKADVEREQGGYVVRERRSGSFHRSLRLSEHVDTDKVEPRYENGVLTITLPVAESKKAKHLKVAVGAALPEAE